MQKFLRTLMLVALMLVPFASRAQVTVLPYSCDFEDAAEASEWTFVNGTLTNQWVLGTAANNTASGSYGIYISNDEGTSAAYTVNSAAVVYAYREIYLTPGEYTVSFDWKCYGESTYDYLLAALVESSVTLTAGTSLPTGISNTTWTAAGWTKLGPTSSPYKLNLSSTWNTQTASITITTAGTYRIVFVWRDDTSGGTAPGACVDNVVVTQNACPTPSNLLCNNTTSSSIDLAWTESGSATSWLVYVNGAQVATANSTSYTITGLNANTDYTIGVRSLCGVGDTSNVATISCHTPCEDATIPYTENFDSYTTSTTAATGMHVPCWSFTMTGSSSYQGTSYQPQIYYSSTNANSGNYSLRLYGVSYTCLPPMAEPLNTLKLTFSAYTTGTAYKLAVGVMEGSTFVPVDTLVTTPTSTHLDYTVYFGSYTGTSRTIAFRNFNTSATTYYAYSYIDDIVVDYLPACSPVTNLTVSGATTNSITLSWLDNLNTSATYTVADAQGDIASGITGNTYTVTGLNPGTQYTFHVIANCSATENGDTATVSGYTACGTIAAADLPYSEDFEAYASGSSATIHPCWTKGTNSSTAYPYPSTTVVSGARCLYFYGNKPSSGTNIYSYAALPQIDATLDVTGLTIGFKAKRYSTTTANYRSIIYVGVMTDPTDATTFVAVDTINMTPLAASTIETYFVDLANYTGTGKYVAFYCPWVDTTAVSYNYIYIDDVVLDVTPNCQPITNLTVSAVTSSSITLTWVDADNSGATYTVYDMSDNSVVATGIASTTYTVTNLDANTQYTFGVKANCSATDESPMVTVAGRTTCAAEELPFSEDFTATLASDPCWRGASIVYTDGVNVTMGTNSNWTYTSSESNGIAAGHYRVNIYGSSCYKWMITPEIDLTEVSNPMLSFDAVFTVYSGTGAATGFESNTSQKFMILVSTNNGATWTIASDISLTSIASSTYLPQYVNLAPYAGETVRIAFYAQSTTSGGDNNLHIDNILVQETTGSICYPVTGLAALNVTSDSATLAWDGDADSYNVYVIGTDTVFVQNTLDTFLVLGNLTPMTGYTYGVASVCGTDESDMMSVTFATACSAVTLPFTETFEATSGTRGCWTTDGPGTWSFATGDYSASTGAFEGSLNAKITHSSDGNATKLISPVLDDVTNGLQLVFAHIQRSWSGDQDELRVYYRTAATSAWQQLAAYTDEVSTWTVETINIPGDVYQVAFEMTDGYGYGVAVDSVVFNLPPSCMAPAALAATNITTDSATLTWAGSASSYNVYVIDTDTSFVATANDTYYEIGNLTAMTTYTYGVTAVCGSDESEMVTVTFATACAPVTLPYTETFEATSATRNCWNLVSNNTNNVGSSNGMGFCTVNGRDVLRFSSYSSATDYNQYGFSPLMNVSSTATNLQVTVTYGTYGTSDELYFGYVTATDTVWDATAYTTNGGYSGTDWQTQTFVIPATATQLAVHYYGNYSYYGWIDSVIVTEVGSPVVEDSCTMTLPFAESFDSTSATRACWTTIDADGDSLGWTTIYNGQDMGMMLSASYDNTLGALTPDNWLVSPKIHTVAGNNITLQWSVAAADNSYAAEHYGVYVSTTTTDTAAFTLLNEWTLTSANTTNMVQDLSAYAGQDIYVAFRHFNCTDMFLMIIDDVNVYEGAYVPDTLNVTFQVNDATMGTTDPVPGTYQYLESDTVFFNAIADTGYHFNGWEIIRGTGDDADTMELGDTYATGYYVLASAWLDYGSVIFKANFEADPTCSPVAIPYTEDFSTDYADYCWSMVNCAANTGINSGAFRFAYNTNPPQYFISPELTGTGATLQFEFDYRAQSANYPESFMVGYSTTTNDTSAFTWSTEVTNITNSTYEHYTQVFNASAIKYVAIKYTANDMFYLYIDNVVVRDVPTCAPVTNLTASAVTTTSATLSWTDTENTGATYTVYEDTTVVATGITGTTYNVTGLTAATNYTFRVVANCSATDASDAMTVVVTTPCDAVTVFPFIESFDVMPNCWTLIDADGDGYNWNIPTGYNSIQSASYQNGVLHPDNWLITPQLAIPSTGNYEVTWTATAQDQNWPAEHYGVYVSTTGTDTSNFTLLQEWTLSTGVFNPVIDLSNYAGQNIYIALRHFNCSDMFRISIDDFIVRAQADANQVVITLQQNNPAYGSVSGAGTYNIGDSVTVSATPNSSYVFSRWVDTANVTVSNANPYTFVAATSMTLKAIFLDAQATTYTITVDVNDSTMGTATGGGTYASGEIITLSATANTGYHFVNWTHTSSFGVTVFSTDATTTVTVTGDNTYTANFAADSVPPTPGFTVTFATNNATMGTTNPAPGTYTYQAGDTVWYAATPTTGYYFQYWVMTYTYQGQVYNDTSSASEANGGYLVSSLLNAGINHVDMTAYFGTTQPAVDSIAVTYTVNDATMGSINPSGTVMTAVGDYMAATATANDGYEFYGWQVTLSVGGQTLQDTTFLTSETSANFGAVAQLYADYNASFTITALFRILDGINGVTADMNIYSTDNKIIVKGAEGEDIYIYDLNGRTIATKTNASETMEFTMVSGGVYMVKVGNAPAKRVLVIR